MALETSGTPSLGTLGTHSTQKSQDCRVSLQIIPPFVFQIDLIARMSRKLKVLKEEQRAVEEEIRSNNELGASLFALVDDSPILNKPAKDRFRQFIVDTENITQLLLKLSCQLARMDNELNRLPPGQHGDKMAKEKVRRGDWEVGEGGRGDVREC